MLPGVYQAKKKDDTIYFRSSITYSGKHISLGSFETISNNRNLAGQCLAASQLDLDCGCSILFCGNLSLIGHCSNRLVAGSTVFHGTTIHNLYLRCESFGDCKLRSI